MDNIIRRKPELLVFVDLPVDQEAEKIRRISEELPTSRILIIDHHIPEADMNSERIVHINHMFRHDIYIPSSYQVYWLLERMRKHVEPLSWIAAIGIIGDYGFRECKDFLSKCRTQYPGLIYENPLESKLGKAAELVSSAVTFKGLKGANRALESLVKAKEYKDFAGDRELVEYDKAMKEEIDRILEEFHKTKEEHPEIDLIIFEVKSKLNLSSVIASILARLYPDDIIIVRKKSARGWKLSLRTQTGKVNVGALVKGCVQGIGAGGGHEKAAGALVENWETFKNRFIQEIS